MTINKLSSVRIVIFLLLTSHSLLLVKESSSKPELICMLRLRCTAIAGVPTAAGFGRSSIGACRTSPPLSPATVATSARPPSSVLCAASSLRAVHRRTFFAKLFGGPKSPQRIELNETLYDTTTQHYQGSIMGVKTDVLVYYTKVYGSLVLVAACIYLFFKGYIWLAEFSLVTVGKLGFTAGFLSCGVLYSIGLMLMRRYRIAPNAVYNQAIAMTLKHPEVIAYLGPNPKTGEFRAFCMTGGFKLPLWRRIRSGAYELSDLLGTKPRRLQMMLVLRSPDGKEGLVSCDVRTSSAGIHATHYFHSLAVHLSNPGVGSKVVPEGAPKSVIIIGRDEDVVYKGLMRF